MSSIINADYVLPHKNSVIRVGPMIGSTATFDEVTILNGSITVEPNWSLPIVSTNTTESTSTSTGAITTLGGVGIAKNLNVGGALAAASGSIPTFSSTSLTVQDITITGTQTGGNSGSGAEVDWSLPIVSTNTTQSTSTSTGAITTLGGVGIAKNLNVGGALAAVSGSIPTLSSTSLTVQDITITGTQTGGNSGSGTEVDWSLPIISTNTTQSTSTSTGAITTLGGVGIAKNLNVGGALAAVSGSIPTFSSTSLTVQDITITGTQTGGNSGGSGLPLVQTTTDVWVGYGPLTVPPDVETTIGDITLGVGAWLCKFMATGSGTTGGYGFAHVNLLFSATFDGSGALTSSMIMTSDIYVGGVYNFRPTVALSSPSANVLRVSVIMGNVAGNTIYRSRVKAIGV